MVDGQRRRVEDSGFGKMVYFWPLIGGIGMIFLSVGGYIATIKYMSNHINIIENWISSQEVESTERNNIMSRLTALQEMTDRRITRLEEWRDLRGAK